jgi:hypothetical protein
VEGLSLILKYVFIIGMYIFLGNVLRALYIDINKDPLGAIDESIRRLMVVSGDEHIKEGQAIQLSKSSLIMGRDDGCDLILGDDYVSKHHAQVLIDKGRPMLEDLGSTNGTYLNGKKISRRMVLKDGDIIKIGGITLRFRE